MKELSDLELVERYLKEKKAWWSDSIIPEFHRDYFDPANLIACARRERRGWYLFSLKHQMRRCSDGYWKETGPEEAVMADGGTRKVGLKKTFTFFHDSIEATKAWWMMDEYSLLDNNDWVLCRIYVQLPPELLVPSINNLMSLIDGYALKRVHYNQHTLQQHQVEEEYNVSIADSMDSLEFVEASDSMDSLEVRRSSESEQPYPMFNLLLDEPLRSGEEQQTQECGFAATSPKTTQCNQNEDPRFQEQHQVEECNIATSNSKSRDKGKRILEEQNVVASNSKEKEKGKRKICLHLSLEPLQSGEEQQTQECGFAAASLKTVQYNQNERQHTQEQHQVEEECNIAISNSKRRNRGKRITKEQNAVDSDSKGKEKRKGQACLHLSLETLESHFGKILDEVSNELGVGRSTIKRACRDYGIDRWPSKKTHKMNPSLFQRQSGRDSQQETRVDHVIVEEEAEKVIVKVQYEEDIVKFEFCLSLGVSKLFEEVATKLNLEVGAFKLKYMDEDDDEILLTSDDDFKLCRKSQITMDKTCIKLFARR